MIVVKGIPQGGHAWLMLRLGLLTASNASKLLTITEREGYGSAVCPMIHKTAEVAAKCKKCSSAGVEEVTETKTNLSAQRDAILYQLLAEWAIGAPVDDWGGSYWTDRGQELEAQAAAYFKLQTGLDYELVSFVYRDESKTCGASPDGLVVGKKSGLEIKCPAAQTQVQYLLDGLGAKYSPQVQFSLWVTGLDSWYFMSYHPDLPEYLVEVQPDPKWQAAFDEHVPKFLEELAQGRVRLRELGVDGIEEGGQ